MPLILFHISHKTKLYSLNLSISHGMVLFLHETYPLKYVVSKITLHFFVHICITNSNSTMIMNVCGRQWRKWSGHGRY